MKKPPGSLPPALAVLILSSMVLPRPATAQGGASTDTDDEGIPIDNQAVIEYCSECHTQDESGRMTRLSYMRKTPEGWQSSIRRMISLSNVFVYPTAAREIVRYLSNSHGLAPEEFRPGRFEVERRIDDWQYEADEGTEETCSACHSMGRVITQRRTEEEWNLLMEMHRGYYPLVDYQNFRYMGPAPGSARAPRDTRDPMAKAVEHLSEVFPLVTPEWTEWAATMRPARLAGTWAISATQTGYGRLFGEVVIEAVPQTDDEFTTSTTITYARSGRTVTRRGGTSIYTGYQWRGRSTLDDGLDPLREVMLVERDWQEISGRWFGGGYDEFGLDVTLDRVGSDAMVLGLEPRALRRGADDQEVSIFGANLPAGLTRDAIDLGPGLTVGRVVRSAAGSVTVIVDVDDDASIGARDVFVARAGRSEALFIYDEVHSIRVNPEWGMARVGGAANFPKGYTQFEARAYHDGADGTTGTDDDVDLGMVDATWSLEEYSATLNDNDLDYVGGIDRRGLFTPALDGPNPERIGNRNNIGDVWVVASYQPESADAAIPARARSHLIVTVPLYMRWDPWGDIR